MQGFFAKSPYIYSQANPSRLLSLEPDDSSSTRFKELHAVPKGRLLVLYAHFSNVDRKLRPIPEIEGSVAGPGGTTGIDSAPD